MILELVFWIGFIALLAIGLALSVKQVLDNKKLGELIAKQERLISEILTPPEAEKWKRAYEEEKQKNIELAYMFMAEEQRRIYEQGLRAFDLERQRDLMRLEFEEQARMSMMILDPSRRARLVGWVELVIWFPLWRQIYRVKASLISYYETTLVRVFNKTAGLAIGATCWLLAYLAGVLDYTLGFRAPFYFEWYGVSFVLAVIFTAKLILHLVEERR